MLAEGSNLKKKGSVLKIVELRTCGSYAKRKDCGYPLNKRSEGKRGRNIIAVP